MTEKDKNKKDDKLETTESKSTMHDSETVSKPSKIKSKKTGRRVRKKVAPAYMTRPAYVMNQKKKQAD